MVILVLLVLWVERICRNTGMWVCGVVLVARCEHWYLWEYWYYSLVSRLHPAFQRWVESGDKAIGITGIRDIVGVWSIPGGNKSNGIVVLLWYCGYVE